MKVAEHPTNLRPRPSTRTADPKYRIHADSSISGGLFNIGNNYPGFSCVAVRIWPTSLPCRDAYQQMMIPSSRSAQVCPHPASMAVNLPSVGTFLILNSSPQQATIPLVRIPQAWSRSPTDTATN